MLALGCSRNRIGARHVDDPRLLGIFAAVLGSVVRGVAGGDIWKGSWKFEMDRQDRPGWAITTPVARKYSASLAGRISRWMRSIRARRRKRSHQGSITIANGKTQMDFAGIRLHDRSREMADRTPVFQPAGLGHPELDEDKWRALENRVLDLLGSGRPLTISAEGKSYVLPAVKVPRWRARFQKIC